jgi:predicted RNA-binding Zn-ribbon protein involved in translation (DUF1610 family)
MASKRHIRRRACGTKRAYPDQTAAVRAIIVFNRSGDQLVSYRCPHCGSWHLARRRFMTAIR